MTARKPNVVQTLKGKVRKRLEASATLSEEYKQVQRARNPSRFQVIVAFLLLPFGIAGIVFLPIALIYGLHNLNGADGLLTMHAFLSTIVALAVAVSITSRLKSSKVVTVHSHLPWSDRDLAWKVLFEAMLVSLLLLYPNAIVYGVIAHERPFDWMELAWAIILTGGQWAVCVATGIIMAVWLPARLVSFMVCVSPFLLVLVLTGALGFKDEITSVSLLALPTGWLNALLKWGIHGGDSIALWALVPAVLLCVFALSALTWFLEHFRVREFLIRHGEEAQTVTGDSQSSDLNTDIRRPIALFLRQDQLPVPKTKPLSVTEAKTRIRSREFLNQQNWSELGWIERLADRWLSPRERILIEFLSGRQINWTEIWSTGFWTMLLMLAVFWGLMKSIFLPLAFLCLGLVYNGLWPAFRNRSCGGTYTAQVSSFPIGLGEIWLALSKVGLARTIAVSGMIIPISLLATERNGLWPWHGFLIALVICTLIFIGTFWYSTILIAQMMTFPKLRLRSVRYYVAWCFLVVCFLGGNICTLMSLIPNFPFPAYFGLGSFSIVIAATVGNWLLLRRLYQREEIDLVSFKKSGWDQANENKVEKAHQLMQQYRDLRARHGRFWWLKRDLGERTGDESNGST